MANKTRRGIGSLDAIVSVPAEELVARSKMRFEILPDLAALYDHFARAIAAEIAQRNAAGEPARLILPVGPVDQYPRLVELCNRERISWRNVHAFHMDDYLDWQGRALPLDHPLSFEGFMRRTVYERLDPDLRIPTMWVTFIQGIFGVTPWVVMGAYFVTWLVDERSVPQTRAPLVFGVILIGQAIAQLVGGLVADWAHRRSPKRGRIVVSQISILNGVWMTAFLFSVPLEFVPVILAGLVTGSMIGWAGKGGRDPILQSVLRPELRSTAWAMIAAVEGGLSALSAFLAGWLAEVYGLQTAMLACVPASWLLLFVCWFGYYVTYPRDEARLRAAMAERRTQIEGES